MKVLLIFFYFILLNNNFQLEVNTIKLECSDSERFFTVAVDCISKDKFQNQLSCSSNKLREDGINCIEENTCDSGQKSMQKNYFGIFLRKEYCSNNTIIENYNDIQFREVVNTGCSNEKQLVCEKLLNLFALEHSLTGYYYSLISQNRTLFDRMILDKSLLNDTSRLSKISYLLPNKKETNNDDLNFYVAKYYYNGTFFKFDKLENDFLQCSNSNDEKTNFKRFGNNVISTCSIDITKYKDYRNNTFFYEIYLKVIEEGKPHYVEIPINVTNDDIIVKRMFLHINLGTNFSYAEKVKLCVKTIKGSNLENKDNIDKIYLPHFEVTYNNQTKLDYFTYTFVSEYKSEYKEIFRAMYGIFITITIIPGLIIIYRIYVWCKLNPKELIENNYCLLLLLEIIYKTCKYIGKFYFWFTFGVSAYWYLFYKIQFRIYYLMPPLDDKVYNTFKIIFDIGFCCYIIFMLIRIYKQVSFDVFFIDWETEKNMAMNDVKSSLDKSVKYKKYRSAWRMIHVVNQFNELQKKRVFNLYFGFSWIVLFYFIAKKPWIGREKQIPRDANIDNAPINFVLRNFIAGIMVLSSAAVQLILVRLFQIWIPLKKQEFMDLCSVSNISVFILDGLLHGYYIHGHSPIGKADVNYDDLFRFLNEEGRGTIRNRGLENDNDDDHCKNQCYEMFISHAMRTIYDGLYIIQNESMLAKKVNTKKFFRRSKLGMRLFRNYLNYEKDQTMLDNYMNNQLKTKIDIVSSNIMQYIKDKTILQRIFGYTIDNSEFMKINAPDIIFYRDYGQKFDDVLFCGMEWEWFIMDLYFFQMLMIYTDDKFISMFCTFIFDFLLYYIRIYFGNKNVAKKAVVDDRFLN